MNDIKGMKSLMAIKEMKNKKDRKMMLNSRTLSVVLWVAGITMLLASCSGQSNTVDLLKSNRKAVEETDFIHRLYLERDDYREGDRVTFISELEYVGDRDSVTINHAMTPFFYAISESSEKYLFPFMMDQPLIYTTLYPGKPHIETYSSGAAYIKDEESEFSLSDPAEVPFPAGDYKVVGSAEFNVGEFGKENENEALIEVAGNEITFTVAP